MAKGVTMKFFSVDGGFYKFISRFWDMIKLNFCWLICSIPIITIGVSTIAALSVTHKMVEDKEGHIVRAFFKAFKQNFKQGMGIGIITLVCLYAVYLDFALSSQLMFWILGIISAFLFTIALIYTYPLLARYDNTVIRTIRNSMRISMRYFGRTVFLVLVIAVELFIFRLHYITLIIGVLIGPMCILLTISGFSMALFHEIEKNGGAVVVKPEEDSEETEQEE